MRTAVAAPIVASRLVLSAVGFQRSPPHLRLPLRRQRPARGSIAAPSCYTMESAGIGDSKEEEKEKGAVEKPAPAAPLSPTTALLPPEKPLPGDCCGSGCVRCVWDIYYEELEAYNNSLAASKTKNLEVMMQDEIAGGLLFKLLDEGLQRRHQKYIRTSIATMEKALLQNAIKAMDLSCSDMLNALGGCDVKPGNQSIRLQAVCSFPPAKNTSLTERNGPKPEALKQPFGAFLPRNINQPPTPPAKFSECRSASSGPHVGPPLDQLRDALHATGGNTRSAKRASDPSGSSLSCHSGWSEFATRVSPPTRGLRMACDSGTWVNIVANLLLVSLLYILCELGINQFFQ